MVRARLEIADKVEIRDNVLSPKVIIVDKCSDYLRNNTIIEIYINTKRFNNLYNISMTGTFIDNKKLYTINRRNLYSNNYVYDAHGDVTSILNSNGTKTKEYEYNAFGVVDSETNTSTYNPWQYCGEYRDEESGLIYLRNRYYDQSNGRFINEDPAKDGLNWYAYCEGNPVMFVDPLGLKDVMVRYIAEKNGGTASAQYDSKGYTKSVTISINDKTKTYTVSSGDVKIVHGRAIIDNKALMSDFGLSEDESLHYEGDVFNCADDAALAFGLMYHEVSMEEQQEYGATIDRINQEGVKYIFNNVTNSLSSYPAAVSPSDLNESQRRKVHIEREKRSIATIHTHWALKGNLNFSNPADYE